MAFILDRNGFEQLFKEHYAALCRAVYRVVPDNDVAEDIVQEVFCWLWNNRETLTVQTTIKSYLYQSCINRGISHLRKQKNALSRETLFSEEISTERNATDEYITFKETTQKVNEVINALPIGCRTVFMLSRFENMSYKEIAAELNISVKTVENHMVKALKFLRLHLLSVLAIIFFQIY